jgi:hypothetical protein
MTVCSMPECQTTAGCLCAAYSKPFRFGSAPAWVCPKCERVYGPHISGCASCNEAAERVEERRKGAKFWDFMGGIGR